MILAKQIKHYSQFNKTLYSLITLDLCGTEEESSNDEAL